MNKFSFILFICLLQLNVFSQKGKNGVGNISISTVVNAYTALTVNAFTGNTTINVVSGAGYAIGDLIYIIQMQGASVNCFSNIFGNPNNIEPISTAFGKITNYNNSGNNEYAQVSSIAGNIITIDCPLKNNYTAAGKVQVVKVPRYTSLTITATGTITCPPWNGTTGGVIAIEVDGNTIINAGGAINASGLGFRGGAITGKTVGSVFGGGSFGNSSINEGGYKGESIAGSVLDYSTNFNGPFCKGAVANGGGGGNGNNAGGGGGANAGDTLLYTGTGNPDISIAGYVTAWNLESVGFSGSTSSGGGRGGYSYSNNSQNPRTTAPGLAVWSGDNRRVAGGIGGRPLNYNTGRLYCGGGGGAADENDAFGGGGGNGGGVINIISYGTVTGAGQIIANGQNGFNTLTPVLGSVSGRDGAGGAGGGGAIVINSAGLISALTVSARGGDGGNQQMRNGGSLTAGAYGPGGGGGGGYLGTTAAAIITNVSGGVNGTVQYIAGLENCQIDIVPATNSFPANGSTMGGAGTLTSTLLTIPTITASPDVTICINNSTILTATTTGPPSTIGWYTNFAGTTLLGIGSAFTTSVFTTVGTYTIWAGFCPSGIYRDPVIITVTNGPTLTATSPTICSGQTATLVASGATTYTWNTGSNSATINLSPLATTVYTVLGANGTCTTATTATVTVNSGGAIAVNSATICSGQTATLTAGAASSYTWSTTQNIQTINVNPLSTTVYTVNATISAGCSANNTATVTVKANPTVTINSPSICLGQTATLTAVGATSYFWYDGSSLSTNTVSPATNSVFNFTGTTNGCATTGSANVVVTPNPTVSANSVSICVGQTAILSGAGAISFTWNPLGINFVGTTFTASPPSSTTYSLLGATNGCLGSTTVNVNVGSNLSIAVNNATICTGQSATLMAISSATNYSWSNGALTNSISVNPILNTSYTINANFAGCTGSTTATIFVNATPTLIPTNQNICLGQSATLTAIGATSYFWSTASTASSIIVSPITNTIYALIGANATCTSSTNYNVIVNALPTIITNSASICNGASATLTANGATTYTWLPLGTTSNTISVNPSSNTSYTVVGSNGSCTNIATASVVVTNGGTVAVNGATVCNGQSALIGLGFVGTSYLWNTGAITQSINVAPNVTTIYSVQIVLGGCVLSGSTTVGITPAPIINAIGASICAGDNANIFAVGAINYTWMPGNLTGNSINVSPNNTTTYVVSTFTNGCTSTATAQVQVNTKPSVSLTPLNALVCPNTALTLTASGANSYDWYVDGVYYFGNPLLIKLTKTAGIVVVGSNGGCTNTIVTAVNVSTLNATFNAESNYVDYPGSLSFTNTSNGYNNILWDFGNGQTSTNNNVSAFYEYPGKYLVTLLTRDTLGCADTTFYIVEAGCGVGDIFIPNTFTPNGDGLNDEFKVFGGTCLSKFSGTIFDRWGHKLFEFKNLADVWDGKVKGIDVELGTYNYLINYTQYNGKQFSKTGVIIVIR